MPEPLVDARPTLVFDTSVLSCLNELMIFSDYVRLLDIGKRDVGEAATLTWAEIHGAVAVVDDQPAVDVARTRGVQVRRTLALIAAGIQNGLFDHPDAIRLVDDLRCGGGRFPCEGRDFIAWARFNDLLS